VLLAWIILAAVLAPLASKFESVQKNEPSSFLPGDAESVRVLEASDGFAQGQATPAIVVYSAPAGFEPTRDAMLLALAVTGGVITSAGVVLAGTFAVLAVLPLIALTQLGITVALGVLLDTLIVRSILVPALTFELGERTWWPSRFRRESPPG